ncbi:MAG: RNA polymerase sigma factor [bacterium]
MEVNKDFLNLIEGCINRKKDAWNTFVDTYAKLIYNYIIRSLGRYSYPFHDDDLDEIFNNVFLALLEENYKRLRNFRGQNERSFAAYLRQISFHISIDFLRQQRRFQTLEQIEYKICSKDNYEKLDYDDLREIIGDIKGHLPERHNYLFHLIYEEELDSPEIAEILNIKLNAVHQLKFRMIQNLIKIIKKQNLYEELEIFIKGIAAYTIDESRVMCMN